MNIKIAAIILGLLALGSLAFLGLKNTPANNTPFDFGDAVDPNFPSLFKSNGARAKTTNEIWLGLSVTTENDSKQVNLDENDDGLKVDLSSCKKSKAYFFVHIKNPGPPIGEARPEGGKTSGTAYLNFWADWNRDGKWQENDECASEWAVRNFPVDLSKQNQEIALYVPEFTAGKNIHDIWYRGTVSNQQMNESSTGEFTSGEVEDYNSKEPDDEKYYGAYCDPDPLIIKHGNKGDIKVLPVFFSEPINKLEFGQNYNPSNDKRKVSIQNNILTYESKDIDPPKRSDNHFVELKASFGASATEAVLEGWCKVVVEHDEITIKTPSKLNPPRRAFPEATIESGHPTSTPQNSPSEPESHIQEKSVAF